VLEFDLNGEIVINVYHATSTDPITGIKLLTIAQIMVSWWIDTQSDSFSQDLTLLSVETTDISIENGERVTLPASPFTPGAVLVEATPNNVAQVVTFLTAKTGRSFRGRSYLCGIDKDSVTDNEISLTATAVLAANFAQLRTDLDVEGVTLSVASFYHNLLPRVEGVATPIDSFRINQRVDTQRRRLPSE
jgi:hypothetical protein